MSAVPPALVLTIAVLAAGTLASVEWRRGDRRRRAARTLASIAAAAALSLLGLYKLSSGEPPRASPETAVLWTRNAGAAATHSGPHFALSGAAQLPSGTMPVPDVGYIRREFPGIKKLRVVGDGLEPWDLASLDGLEVVFDAPARPSQKPTMSFIRYPREVALGEPLQLQGRIDALAAGSTVAVAVVGPDGERTETSVTGQDAGRTTFAIAAPAPRSEGRFTWRVTARTEGGETMLEETLGIAVVRPTLPRVLVIESSPRLDTAHLQRWFGEIGGTLVTRTTVGQARHRFTSSLEATAEFGTVDRELLERFDVLLVDAPALSGLPPDERNEIKRAVAEEGLGMLALAGGDEPGMRDELLFPWKTERLEGETPVTGELGTARLQWPGLDTALEHPVGLENMRLNLADGQSALVTDTQDRPIVATQRHGRGSIAVSTARDTWRWRLQDESDTFAGYWSHLLGRLAKPSGAHAQRWTIENARHVPLAVNQPIEVRLAGAVEAPGAVHVTSASGQGQAALALANDPAEPQQWRGTFWPRRAGWHTVQIAPDGARLDFFVHEANAWASLAPARRTAATQVAALRRPMAETPSAELENKPLQTGAASTVLLYLILLVSSGYLWLERRRATA